MFSKIKSHFLWTIISLLTISGCGISPAPQEDGSKLQGIYDQEYVLQFFQKENSDIYMLRSCLGTEGVGNFKEGSCVPALRNHEGEPVTFTLQELDNLSFGQEEKDRLNKALERWRPYQQALQNRQAGRIVAVSVAVGGAAVTKHLLGKRSAAADALAASQAQLVKAQHLLKKGEPNPVKISDDYQYLANPQHAARKAHLMSNLSNQFIDYVRTHAADTLESQNIQAVDAFVNTSAHTLDYKGLVQGFVAEGHKPTDIIDADFLDEFLELPELEKLAKDTDKLAELLMQKPTLVFDALNAHAIRCWDHMILGFKADNSNLIKSQVKVDNAKDGVNTASKQLRKATKKVIIGAVVTLTAVVGILALSDLGIKDVEETVNIYKEKNQYLLEVLGAASPLFTPYSNEKNNAYIMATELPVKDILKNIALLPTLTTEAGSSNSEIQLYCLPTVLENGEIGAECREP